MTEAEWLACETPGPMLVELCSRLPERERKLRLFGIACCREHWHAVSDARLHRALDFAERQVDGRAEERERAEVERAILDVFEQQLDEIRPDGSFDSDPILALLSIMKYTAEIAAAHVEQMVTIAEFYGSQAFDGLAAELAYEHSLVLRDIFGNPFRPVAFNPAWHTSDVLAMARGIYDEKAFDRMPILADALQDAGCDSSDILNHCRDANQVHVRGCWVVDLVLGLS